MSNYVSAHYIMRKEPEAQADCGIQQGINGSQTFAFLDLGRSISVLPTIQQLIQIRDAINACLETSEAQALLPVPLRTVTRVKSAPNPRLGLDVQNLVLALEVSTEKLRLLQNVDGYDFQSCIDNNKRLIAQVRGETV